MPSTFDAKELVIHPYAKNIVRVLQDHGCSFNRTACSGPRFDGRSTDYVILKISNKKNVSWFCRWRRWRWNLKSPRISRNSNSEMSIRRIDQKLVSTSCELESRYSPAHLRNPTVG